MPGKPGRGQPNALDRLDAQTRDKCINLLLSGKKGAQAEAARVAGVSRQAVNEYVKRHLSRALEISNKVLQADARTTSVSEQMVKTVATVKEVAGVVPIIAVREKRLAALQDTQDRLLRVMRERGEEMAAEVPGGATGLLTKDYKGKDADQPVYKLDSTLLQEMREYMKQAAIELGEWQEGTVSASAQRHIVIIPVPVQQPSQPHRSPVIDVEPDPGE